jgi:hypothetical protein
VVKHGGDIVASMIVADARGTVKHNDATNGDDVSAVWSISGTIVTLTGSVAEGAQRPCHVPALPPRLVGSAFYRFPFAP